LFENQIQSVIIEGGRQTLQTFISEGMWDEARVFKGPNFLNEGTKAPILNRNYFQKTTVFDDELLIFENND
jgi:diaminohydroxyphosphoribosylaminopyrimidine deaminase/5-amino-6-(5-phosphoribosylamino)uracil reductase